MHPIRASRSHENSRLPWPAVVLARHAMSSREQVGIPSVVVHGDGGQEAWREKEQLGREPCCCRDACGLRGEKRRLAFVFFSNSQNDHGIAALAWQLYATERGTGTDPRRGRRPDREFTCDHHPLSLLYIPEYLSLPIETERERWSKKI